MSTSNDNRTAGKPAEGQVQVQKGQGHGELQQAQARRVRAPVDIYESADELLLYADLPGVAPSDLDIRLENGLLSFEGRRTWKGDGNARPQTGWVYQRSFQLPGGTDGEKIQASLRNGVLELHLPKREQVKPRQIKVTTE